MAQDRIVIPESVKKRLGAQAGEGQAAEGQSDRWTPGSPVRVPDSVRARIEARRPPPPAPPPPGLGERIATWASDQLKPGEKDAPPAADLVAFPMGRGLSDLMTGRAPVPDSRPLLERPLPADDPARIAHEQQQGSIAPRKMDEMRAEASRPPPRGARPFGAAQNIAQDIRESTKNPVLLGTVAGVSMLGKTGVGAVRLAADLVGAEDVSNFARGASMSAETIGTGATRDLTGNRKLVADVTNSILGSAPSLVVGMAGGPALKLLFAQSTLAEYNAGRDAGFDPGESLGRAGIMGFAEAFGERFGFGEQITLLKSVTKGLPQGEIAKVFGQMLTKEIPGEQLTTAMQTLADKIGPAALAPNASISDYLNAAGETLKVTIGQTAVMGGGPAVISSARNEMRRADALAAPQQTAADRAAGLASREIDSAADRYASYFTPQAAAPMPPTQAREASVKRFDELAAAFGLNPKAAAKVREQAGTMAASEAPGFLARVTRILNQRGMFKRPVDDADIGELGQVMDQVEAPEGEAKAPAAAPAPAAPPAGEGDFTGLDTPQGEKPATLPALAEAPPVVVGTNEAGTPVIDDGRGHLRTPDGKFAPEPANPVQEPSNEPVSNVAAPAVAPSVAPAGRGPDAGRGVGAVGSDAGDAAGRGNGDPAAPVAGAGPAQPVAAAGGVDAALTPPAGPRVIGRVGRTPKAAEDVDVRPNADGTLTPYMGGQPMLDYDSAEPIVVPAESTDREIADAIERAGAIGGKSKFYGVADDPAPDAAAPGTATPSASPSAAAPGAAAPSVAPAVESPTAFKPRAGESLKLDGKDWTVDKVTPKAVTLTGADGKKKRVEPDSPTWKKLVAQNPVAPSQTLAEIVASAPDAAATPAQPAVDAESAVPAPAAAPGAKPRLAEAPDTLLGKLKMLAGGYVDSGGGRGILPVYARNPAGGPTYAVGPGGKVTVIEDGGRATRDATAAEVNEFHNDLEADRLWVHAYSRWGGSGGDKATSSRPLVELHSPSGLSWKGKTAPPASPVADELRAFRERRAAQREAERRVYRELESDPAMVGKTRDELAAEIRRRTPDDGLKDAQVALLARALAKSLQRRAAELERAKHRDPAVRADAVAEAVTGHFPDADVPPAQIMARVLKGEIGVLANGWKLERARVSDELRIELKMRTSFQAQVTEMKDLGAIVERIEWRDRVFVPVGKPDVLAAILKNKPLVSLADPSAETPNGDNPAFQRNATPYNVGDARAARDDTRPGAVQAVGVLDRAIGRHVGDDSVHPYVARVVPGDEAIRSVANALGTRVQWFGLREVLTPAERRKFGFFNGVYYDGTIYLRDAGGDRPHLAVLGHELVHRMKATRPTLYKRFLEEVRPFVDQARYAEFVRTSSVVKDVKGADAIREEFLGEVMADAFMDRGFWRSLADKNPSVFGRVVKMLHQLIDAVLKAVGYTPRTERILTDYRRVMDIAADVMAEYAGAGGAAAASELRFAAVGAPTYFSALARAIDSANMKAAPAASWQQWLKGLVQKGVVKADEIEWTGVNEWLDMQQGKVTRDQVRDFVRGNGVQVTETVLSDRAVRKKPEGWTFVRNDDDEIGGVAVLDEQGNVMGIGDTEAEALEDASDPDAYDDAPSAPKYGRYTLPGGTNYREILLTLPEGAKMRGTLERATAYRSDHWDQPNVLAHIRLNDRIAARPGVDMREIGERIRKAVGAKTEGGLANGAPEIAVRKGIITEQEARWYSHDRGFLNVPTEDPRLRVLFVEEIQSDWAQEGKKKGFVGAPGVLPDGWTVEQIERRAYTGGPVVRTEWTVFDNTNTQVGLGSETREGAIANATGSRTLGVPSAPFVDKTDKWVALALKRIIKLAVDEGYDRVAFVNGEQSAERFSLDKHLSLIEFGKVGSDAYRVKAYDKTDRVVRDMPTTMSAAELERHLGKEIAERIVREEGHGRLEGEGLKVEAAGMRAFYDKIVPSVLKDVLKKVGGGVMDSSGLKTYGFVNGQFALEIDDPITAREWVRAKPGRELRAGGDKQPGFDITPAMREKAAGGLPLFQRSNPNHTPEQTKALAKAGIAGPRSMREKVRAYYGAALQMVSDRNHLAEAAWAEFRQGALDQFHGIRRAEKRLLGNLPVELSAYIASRLANGGTISVMRALMLHGQARWTKDHQHLEKIPGTKGLLDILAPLGDDLNDWFGWMVGNRAERLLKEGRENNLTAADIKALKALATPDKLRKFQAAAIEYAAFKRSVLDVAQSAGLIDPEGRKVWDHADYIPFYREIDERAVFSATGKKGLSGQSSGIRKLKGGTAGLNDPMENLLMNFSRLIDASLKNNAILKTVRMIEQVKDQDTIKEVGYDFRPAIIPREQIRQALVDAGTPPDVLDAMPEDVFDGMAKVWQIQQPNDPDVIRVMVGGKPKFYRVLDPLLLRSLTSFVPFDFPGLALMRQAKNVLTKLVTATPEFMVRNWIRDSVAAQAIARHGFSPAASVKGVAKAFSETGGFESMLFAGASFQTGQYSAHDPEAAAVAMRRALRSKGMKAGAVDDFMATVLDTPGRAWDVYRRAGEAIENANREAVYEAAIKAGGSETQAAYQAKDLMDFSLRGSWPAYQVLADTIVFLNARVQGMYRLGRSDPKRLWRVGAMLMVASLVLASFNDGEDWYEELPDWDKDLYWHMMIAGKHVRIPKPFEVGVFFATMPERIGRAIKGLDDGDKTMQRALSNARDQLAIDPVPQLIRPALDVYANWDPFRRKPVENQNDEGKLPSARYSAVTSDTAKLVSGAVEPLSNAVGMSPKRIEYLIGGYFGTIGLYALGASDWMVRELQNAPERPTLRPDDIPLVRAFIRADPARGTVYESDLWAMRQEIEQIKRTILSEVKSGNVEGATKRLAENEAKLEAAGPVLDTVEALSEINKARDAIYADRDMTPAEKRAKLDGLQRERNRLAREAATDPSVRAAF